MLELTEKQLWTIESILCFKIAKMDDCKGKNEMIDLNSLIHTRILNIQEAKK